MNQAYLDIVKESSGLYDVLLRNGKEAVLQDGRYIFFSEEVSGETIEIINGCLSVFKREESFNVYKWIEITEYNSNLIHESNSDLDIMSITKQLK